MAAKDATTKAKAGKKKAIQLPQTVKNQFIQDKKLIPNLVYAMERYDNQIVALSDKLKEVLNWNLPVAFSQIDIV